MSEKLGTPTNVSVDSPNVVCDVVTNADTYAFVVDNTEIGEYDVNVANISYSTSYATTPSPVYTLTLTANDLPTLTDSVHSFDGWYYDDAFTNKANVGDTIEGNITLFAKWGMNHTYTETMGANTIDIRTNKEVIDITYNGSTIATMNVAKKTLKTKEKLVEHPITFGEFSLDKSGRIFADDIVIDRTDELKSPILNVDGETLYITDRNESATEGVRIYVDGVYSKTVYGAIKATVSNLGVENPSEVVFDVDSRFTLVGLGITEETDAKGNVFIKIPTMYRKVNSFTNNHITSFTISPTKIDSSYIPYPIFVEEDGVTVMPYVMVGKYWNTSTSSMVSVAETRRENLSVDTARTRARLVGDGYLQYDWQCHKLWQDLFIMFNQSVSLPIPSYDPLGIFMSGSSMLIDGICCNSGQLAVSYKPSKYVANASSSTDGYVGISYTLPSVGEVKALGYDADNPFVQYPSATVNNSSYNTYYCDASYSAPSGFANIGLFMGVPSSSYGPFCCYPYSSGGSGGARLCYRPVSVGGLN